MAPNIYCCGAGTAADTEAGTVWYSFANDPGQQLSRQPTFKKFYEMESGSMD